MRGVAKGFGNSESGFGHTGMGAALPRLPRKATPAPSPLAVAFSGRRWAVARSAAGHLEGTDGSGEKEVAGSWNFANGASRLFRCLSGHETVLRAEAPHADDDEHGEEDAHEYRSEVERGPADGLADRPLAEEGAVIIVASASSAMRVLNCPCCFRNLIVLRAMAVSTLLPSASGMDLAETVP